MKPLRTTLTAAAVAVIAWTTVRALDLSGIAAGATAIQESSNDQRTGPDSVRVAAMISVLGTGDPLVCEIVADQAGNSWWGNGSGLARFADARVDLFAAKDSLSGRIAHEGTMQLLITTLDHENACVRRLAARWLGRSRIETSRLVALLDHASPIVREAAAYAIGSGNDRMARVALERMLSQRGSAEAAMAAWALAEEQDPASLPALQQALQHEGARVRRTAAYALGEIADLRALDALSTAVGDRDADVRYAAAEAIGELDDLERAPTALVQAARSTDPTLARIAALAIADLHDAATLDLLIELSVMADRDVRRQVAEALGSIGSAKANPALTRLLKDADAEVRRAAAEALGEIRDNASDDKPPADAP